MIDLEIKYTDVLPIVETEYPFHPAGTKVRRFNVQAKDDQGKGVGPTVGIGMYFHPDGDTRFLIIEPGIGENAFCYSGATMAVVAGFMQWLSENKEFYKPGEHHE